MTDGGNPTYTGGELKELVSPADLLRSLECPICTEIPLPPIYQCQNGHNICSNCKPKLSHCGFCNGRLTDTRNFAIESIVCASKFKCRYGCDEIVKGDKQEIHGKSCRFRPIPCFELGGNTRCNGRLIAFKDYFAHLKDTHKIAGESEATSSHFPITSSAPDLLTDRRFPSFYMMFDKFALISNVNIKDGLMQWWVTMIGEEEDAKNYVAKLVLYDPNNQKLQIEWTFPVHSVRKPAEEIHQSALCAILPVACMQPFLKSQGSSSSGQKQCWSTKYSFEKVRVSAVSKKSATAKQFQETI